MILKSQKKKSKKRDHTSWKLTWNVRPAGCYGQVKSLHIKLPIKNIYINKKVRVSCCESCSGGQRLAAPTGRERRKVTKKEGGRDERRGGGGGGGCNRPLP